MSVAVENLRPSRIDYVRKNPPRSITIAAANSVTHCIFSRRTGLLACRHWLSRLTCVFDRNFCLFIQDQAVALVCNGFEAGQHAAGTSRDETADDDVFLETFQRIDLAADCSFGKYAGCFLEMTPPK